MISRSGRERMSIANFFDPDCKALVDPRALGMSEADCICEPA